jgi:sugar phosphate isomerase/epimerase
MRLGMCSCFLPANMNDIDSAMLQRVRAAGFSGIFTRFRDNDPLTTPKADAERLKSLLADNNVRLFQTTGYWQNLVTPDETARAESVKVLQGALRLAGWMGARGIDTGPGSMNPAGPWFPHPDNWTVSAENQLIKSLKECASAAEDAGVFLSLESHNLVTPRTATIAARILDAVDSPWVKCDYDSANWITLEDIYDTTGAVNSHFDILGKHICSAHAKDVWVENRLSIHVQDGCPGKGLMDFATLFNRLEALDPDAPIIAEGNSTEELPEVGALFHRICEEQGIRVLDADEEVAN